MTVLSPSSGEAAEASIRAAAKGLLHGTPHGLERLAGGMNNAIYRFDLGARTLVAKFYFTHPADRRDRLGTEFRVLQFLWDNGTRCIPEPVGESPSHGVAFYGYVDGARLSEGAVEERDLEEYSEFVLNMGRLSRNQPAAGLPNAAEAAFTMSERLGTVAKRLAWLRGAIDPKAALARAFLLVEAAPIFERLRQWAEALAEASGTSLDQPVPGAERILSQGDLGLHNCLKTGNGLVFHDFEYGGWDDAAQVIVQSCLAPAVPVRQELHPRLLARLIEGVGRSEFLVLRVQLYYPVLAVKWSLILLNELVEVGRARRGFSGAVVDDDEASRVAKATEILRVAERVLDKRWDPFGLSLSADGRRE